MTTFRFAAIIEKDADGYYAFCPDLQGCYTQGDTCEEALANLREAVELHVQDRLESGEPIETAECVNLTSVEVAL